MWLFVNVTDSRGIIMTDMIVMDMIHTLSSVITAYGLNVDY